MNDHASDPVAEIEEAGARLAEARGEASLEMDLQGAQAMGLGRPTALALRLAGRLFASPVPGAAGDAPVAGLERWVLRRLGRPGGAWDPGLEPEVLTTGLQHMLVTRLIEEQFMLLQRQGKAAFAMRSLGEEAVAVSAAMKPRPPAPVLSMVVVVHADGLVRWSSC